MKEKQGRESVFQGCRGTDPPEQDFKHPDKGFRGECSTKRAFLWSFVSQGEGHGQRESQRS